MLSPILFLIWLGMRFRTLKDDWRVFWLDLKQRKPLVLAMLVILSATTIANFMLYGLNYIQYKNVVPGCNQVLNNELCMKNRIHARNWVVTEYKNGSMSFMDAYKATDQIWHSGDRDHARRLLYNARQVKMQPPPVMDVVDYMGLVWKQAVMPTVFGVQAHRSMLRASSELLVYAAILAIALVCFIRFLRFDGQDRIWITFAAVSVGYYLFLVGYYNYTSYLSSHAPLLGVQGRYLFLIIVPVYLLSAEFLLRHAPRWLQVILVVLVGSVFIYGDFPYYLANTNDAWYGTS